MRLALLAGVAMTLASAPAMAATSGAPQSTAVGFDAQLRSQGIGSELGPIAGVRGLPSGAYNDSETVAKADQSVIVSPQINPPTLSVAAGRLTSHVSSTGIAIDSRSSDADTALANAIVVLANPSSAGAASAKGPFLSISAKEVMSSADFNIVYGANTSVMGTADIGALTITGQLVGGAKLTYSGAVPPNTVIYQSPTVTVTLNRQIKFGVSVCTPTTCTFKVIRIDVAAVDVALTNAVVDGHKVSGDIVIGDSTAQ